ncbi:MAG TPA: transposase [Phycisphaerae bacterium]|nr:transposase [Phycisphaerae bacterium]
MSDEQNGQRHEEDNGIRRRFTAQQKVAILKEHLVEKVPVSQVCDRHGINPTAFYRWQKEFFENGAAAFEGRSSKADGRARQLEERVEKLSAKLARKDEVIAEVMEEAMRLKKSLGEV